MTELLTVMIITLLAVISPGPDFAMVTRSALVSGKKAGLMTAIGVGVGVWIHVCYSIIGLAALMSQSILLFNIFKMLCAGYLIYFGLRMIWDSRAQTKALEAYKIQNERGVSRKKAFIMGFLSNALNPKATLFFASLFTQVISPETDLSILMFYGLAISLVHIGWFICVAYFFSASLFRSKLISFKHWLDRAFGMLITGLGLSIMTASLQNK